MEADQSFDNRTRTKRSRSEVRIHPHGSGVLTHQKKNPGGEREACSDYEPCRETYMNDVVNLATSGRAKNRSEL